MIKYWEISVLLCAVVLITACSSSKYSALKVKSDFIVKADTKSSKPVIDGPIEWDEWLVNSIWNISAVNSKNVDILLSKSICNLINTNDYFIQIFAGSWCEDSESQLPIIYKIFDKGGINLQKIQLYGLTRDKIEKSGTAEKNKIDKIPSLIIKYKGKEIGRIVEFPTKSWEEDILSILYKN